MFFLQMEVPQLLGLTAVQEEAPHPPCPLLWSAGGLSQPRSVSAKERRKERRGRNEQEKGRKN